MPISISRSLNSKARPGSSTTERLHEYEMQPRGLTTTMVEADGTTRNVIGPTTLYERRRPSLTTDTSSFFEGGSGGLGSLNGSRRNSFCDSLDNAAAAAAAVHRRSMRSRSGTPVRSSGVCNSMMIIPSSASTGNVHSYLNQINNYNSSSSSYDNSGNSNYGRLPHRMILSRPPPKPLPPKPTLYVSPLSPPPMTPRRSLAKLPPLPPRQIKHHYPIPPPSFPDAMVSVSKRLRNRSVSPTPANYAQLQLGSRPGLINAALGISDSPTKESIRRSLGGGGGAGLYGSGIADYHPPSSQFSTGFHARNL